jgi:uncharacterized protein (DUF302 family)
MVQPDYVTTRSQHSFAETVDRLTAAIRAAGGTVFATIDQAAAARQVGLALRPTTLIVFGNPRGGTPVMVAFPPIALQLPLKLVVSETADGVVVLHDRMARIAPSYGVAADHPAIAAMDRALDALANAVA